MRISSVRMLHIVLCISDEKVQISIGKGVLFKISIEYILIMQSGLNV